MASETTYIASATLPTKVDIVVVGGGPAGLATAITLARLGHNVFLLTRPDPGGDKIGESLAPAAIPILQQLGLWERFVAGGHQPCYGNKAAWGSATLRYYDFINDPNGHGWRLDRPLFERQLAEQATVVGVQQTNLFTMQHIERADDAWQLTLRRTDSYDSQSVTLRAVFVVDASGRSSWFARRQGAQRGLDDHQVALIAFLTPTGPPFVETTTLIEAVADGWWYSARLPDGRLVTMLMTDPDLHDQRAITTTAGWQQRMAQTSHTAERIAQGGYQLVNPPRLLAAASGRLDQLWGDGWLAVGDAAMCYDPLAAHGLTLALAGGRDAALALTAHLQGTADALAAYEWRLTTAYTAYAERRQLYYRAEQRWPTAPYWRRRHHSAPTT